MLKPLNVGAQNVGAQNVWPQNVEAAELKMLELKMFDLKMLRRLKETCDDTKWRHHLPEEKGSLVFSIHLPRSAVVGASTRTESLRFALPVRWTEEFSSCCANPALSKPRFIPHLPCGGGWGGRSRGKELDFVQIKIENLYSVQIKIENFLKNFANLNFFLDLEYFWGILDLEYFCGKIIICIICLLKSTRLNSV